MIWKPKIEICHFLLFDPAISGPDGEDFVVNEAEMELSRTSRCGYDSSDKFYPQIPRWNESAVVSSSGDTTVWRCPVQFLLPMELFPSLSEESSERKYADMDTL